MLLLTILFVVVGGAMGGSEGAVMAFVFAAAMNVFSYWFSDKIILRRYAASEVGPEDQSRLYRIVGELAQKAGLPMPKVFVIPEKILMPSQPVAIQSTQRSRRQRESWKILMMMNWQKSWGMNWPM
jgi:Zn-dependent protease with chaperone function